MLNKLPQSRHLCPQALDFVGGFVNHHVQVRIASWARAQSLNDVAHAFLQSRTGGSGA